MRRRRRSTRQDPATARRCKNRSHMVHELKKQTVLTLYPGTNIYKDFSGINFDRVGILTMGSHILDDNDNLDYHDCHDRIIRQGQAYLLGIKLANGSYYLDDNYGDEDDDGSLPTPISPRKLWDSAMTVATKRRQRASVS